MQSTQIMNVVKKGAILLALGLAMFLFTGCQKGNKESAPRPEDSTQIKVDEQVSLDPVPYQDGEAVENPFFKTVMEDGDLFYLVLPESSEELVKLPVSDTVIYEEKGAPYMETASVTLDDGPEYLQYRLFVPLELVTDANTGNSGSIISTQPPETAPKA